MIEFEAYNRKGGRRYRRLIPLATFLVLGVLAVPSMARPTPTADTEVPQISQGGRRELNEAEKLAVLFVGSLSLLASVLHRVHAARRL
jgi:hypothetical protein